MFNVRPRHGLKFDRVQLARVEIASMWSTADVDDLPDSAFLFIAAGGKKDDEGKTAPRSLRKFPYRGKDGEVDLPHLRDALSRLPEADATDMTPQQKEQVKSHAESLLTDTDKKQTATLVTRALTCRIVDTSPNGVPEWVQFFPKPDAGGNIRTQDGRHFKINAAKLCSSFNDTQRDAPFDFEHASEIKSPQGEPAPAVGWIKELAERNGGEVWARIDWNAKGADTILSREYRYVSPAFNVDKSGNVIEVVSAGLTNRPAFTMPALAREQKTGVDKMAMPPELCKELDLPETATIDDVVGKLKQLKAGDGPGGASSKADKSAIGIGDVSSNDSTYKARISDLETQLASAKIATLDPLKVIPRADFDQVRAQLTTLQTERETEKKEAFKKEVSTTITKAREQGKIAPASVEYYTEMCATKEGFVSFQKLVETLPEIAGDNQIPAGKPPVGDVTGAGTGAVQMTTVLREVLHKCGMQEADVHKAFKTRADLPQTMHGTPGQVQ